MDYKNITESLSEMQYRKMVARNNILVSVFMLTHNREKYLRLAVDSVLKQTYGDFVLWILNNYRSYGRVSCRNKGREGYIFKYGRGTL